MKLHYDQNNVCTIRVLSGFKGAQRINPTSNLVDNGPVAKDLDEFKKMCRECVSTHNRYIKNSGQPDYWQTGEQAIIEARTTSLQPDAEQFLTELGFDRLGPFVSGKYGTGVSIWAMHPQEFLKVIEYKEPKE